MDAGGDLGSAAEGSAIGLEHKGFAPRPQYYFVSTCYRILTETVRRRYRAQYEVGHRGVTFSQLEDTTRRRHKPK